MKSKVYGIKISSVLVAVAVVMIVVAAFIKDCATVSSLFNNLGMGVFGSSIVVLLVSFGEYNVEKRKALENYYLCCKDADYAFKKIKYFEYSDETRLILDYLEICEYNNSFHFKVKDETKALNKIIEYYKEIEIEGINSENIAGVIDVVYERIKKTIDIHIKQYEDFDYDTKRIEHCYGELNFLTSNGNKKYKYWIYDNLHELIRKEQKNVNNFAMKMNNYNQKDSAFSYKKKAELLEEAHRRLYSKTINKDEDRIITITVNSIFIDKLEQEYDNLYSMIYNVDKRDLNPTPFFVRTIYPPEGDNNVEIQ